MVATTNAPETNRSSSTLLTADRTRLAHERTLMAWVRTSTSLISFGFTIYKFFQYLQEKRTGARDRLLGPRDFALLMTSIGLVALALASWQHRRDMKALRAQHPGVPYSLAIVLAVLISILGMVALLAAIFRQ